MNKKIDNSEIDLIEVILNLWNNKYKIIFITLIFILVALFYQLIQKKSILRINTLTEIIPITNYDEVKYDAFNFFITKTDQLSQPEETNNIKMPIKKILKVR